MGESAGALLLRSGLITPDQLLAAHAARQRDGSTVGVQLVRLGFVAEDALAEFYRQRLMVPRVDRTALEQLSRRVVDRVPRDMALEFGIIPIDVDREGNLTLAMADPADTHAVDEVAFFSGHYVMRAVANLSDIDWALRNYYGDRNITAASGAERPARAAHPAGPPHAGAYSLAEDPPAGATRNDAQAPPPVESGRTLRFGRVDTSSYGVAGPAGLQVTPPPVANSDAAAIAAAAWKNRRARLGDEVDVGPPGPAPERPKLDAAMRPIALKLLEAVDRLRVAATHKAVANAVGDFLGGQFKRSVLFAVKKGVVMQQIARGELRVEAVRALAIPLDADSLLREVIGARTAYRGPLGPGAVNELLAAALGVTAPEVILVPVTIRERVVGLIYADGPAEPMPDGVLERLAIETGGAYERILLQTKPTSSS
jgi:hypothetical protein